MKCDVILLDGTLGEIECDNYDNAPDAAWKKYGNEWERIIKPETQSD